MLVRLMNETLINKPTDEGLWRLLCCIESDLILEYNRDRLNGLFENVRIGEIDPQSQLFFERLIKKNDVFKEYVKSLNLSERMVSLLKLK